MHICFIDEAGCTGALPDDKSIIQPAFIISGLIIDQKKITKLTQDFLSLKKSFFPNRFKTIQHLDCIKEEIKGSDLRKMLKTNRKQRRFVLGFIDKAIELLEKNDVSLIGRVWIKPVNNLFDGKAVYTYSIQSIASSFQHYLCNTGDMNNEGVIIADSRTKALNANVSHSIFTQKYKTSGDVFNRIIEMPVYGHSDNHAGLQLADFIASALFFPIATSAYCAGYIKNTTHHDPRYLILRDKFGNRLSNLQYRYLDIKNGSKVSKGGMTVSDRLGGKNGKFLFKK